jgi:hypothetical protein
LLGLLGLLANFILTKGSSVMACPLLIRKTVWNNQESLVLSFDEHVMTYGIAHMTGFEGPCPTKCGWIANNVIFNNMTLNNASKFKGGIYFLLNNVERFTPRHRFVIASYCNVARSVQSDRSDLLAEQLLVYYDQTEQG